MLKSVCECQDLRLGHESSGIRCGRHRPAELIPHFRQLRQKGIDSRWSIRQGVEQFSPELQILRPQACVLGPLLLSEEVCRVRNRKTWVAKDTVRPGSARACAPFHRPLHDVSSSRKPSSRTTWSSSHNFLRCARTTSATRASGKGSKAMMCTASTIPGHVARNASSPEAVVQANTPARRSSSVRRNPFHTSAASYWPEGIVRYSCSAGTAVISCSARPNPSPGPEPAHDKTSRLPQAQMIRKDQLIPM